jgi:hypothetical protein
MTKQELDTTLTKLYEMQRCILAKLHTDGEVTSVHPIGQGTFGDMLAMMYDRMLVLPMNELGILTMEGKIYPHDYYPKNVAKDTRTPE